MSLTKDNWILSPELLKLVKVSRDLFGWFCLAMPCLGYPADKIQKAIDLLRFAIRLHPSLLFLPWKTPPAGFRVFDCLVLVDQY